MPRDYSPLRKTVFDLHLERERLPWYFRTLAVVSSWFALGGYILFSLVFTSQENNIKTSRGVLTGLAAGMLAVGYTAIAVTAWFSNSILFLFDCVLLPILTASFMGLFTTVMNHSLHKTFPIPTEAYIIGPLVLASISTVVSAILSFLVLRRLNRIKATDNRRRVSGARFSYSAASPTSGGDPASNIQLLPMQIPEDEAQRQQLLRLLLKRDNRRAPSPDAESTYRIDLPPALSGNERRQYLAVPTYEAGRARSGSMPAASSSSRWGLGKLMPSRNRSPTVDTFKDPRERRREEIERSGSAESTPALLSDPWPSPQPYSPIPAPAWQSTRYA